MNQNCLSHWFPLIEAAGVPVTKTKIVTMNVDTVGRALYEVLDCKPAGPEGVAWIEGVLRPAVEEIGLPCFLRTGETSGKHNWHRTCFVRHREKLLDHVVSLIEFSECCGVIGLPWNVWAVRELLPTEPGMIADRYGHMPVCREFRFFVREGQVECFHPYWPRQALLDGLSKPPSDFEFHYKCLCYLPALVLPVVQEWAARAGAVVGGYWSVDLLETKQGWYVTDMALGHESYHWPECQFAPLS